jgi:hypothetical protein
LRDDGGSFTWPALWRSFTWSRFQRELTREWGQRNQTQIIPLWKTPLSNLPETCSGENGLCLCVNSESNRSGSVGPILRTFPGPGISFRRCQCGLFRRWR